MGKKTAKKSTDNTQGILRVNWEKMVEAIKTASNLSSSYTDKLTIVVELENKFDFRRQYHPVMVKGKKGYRALSIKEYCKVHLQCNEILYDNILIGLQWGYTASVQDRKFQSLIKPLLKNIDKARLDADLQKTLPNAVRIAKKYADLPKNITSEILTCKPKEIADVKPVLFALAGLPEISHKQPEFFRNLPTGYDYNSNPLLTVKWQRMDSEKPVQHETVGFRFQVSELNDLIRQGHAVLNRYLAGVKKQKILKNAHDKSPDKSPMEIVVSA